jgi:hypothetical protein
MRLLTFSIVFIATTGARVDAQDDGSWHPPPEHLTIGYEGEGNVDASAKACEAFVRSMVEWSEDEIVIGTAEVCGARKPHLLAYEALQKSYAALRQRLLTHHKIDAGAAIKSFTAMVKDCIEHKISMSDGGHNIRSDMIPNDDAAICLNMGKQLLDAETDWLTVGFTVSHPAP